MRTSGAVVQRYPYLAGGDHTATAEQHGTSTQRARIPFNADFAFTKAATIAETGNLELVGYASTWVLDRDGEYIDPRAYDTSLSLYLATNPMLLWQHNQDWPLGQIVEAAVDANGLLVRAIVRKPEAGEEPWKLSAYNDIKAGIVRTFSVGGFFTRDFVGGRIVVTEVELLEISVVSIPSNPSSIFEAAQKALGRAPQRPVLPAQAVAQMEQLLGLRTISDPELVVMYTRGTAAEQQAAADARYTLLCDLYRKAGKLPPGRQVWEEAKGEPDPHKRLARVMEVMQLVQGGVEIKAGRVLSKANEGKLVQVQDTLSEALQLLGGVLAQVAQDTEPLEEAADAGDGVGAAVQAARGLHDYKGDGGACKVCGKPASDAAHGGN